MNSKRRKSRTPKVQATQEFCAGVLDGTAGVSSFRKTMACVAGGHLHGVQEQSRPATSELTRQPTDWRRVISEVLGRAWAFLQMKYKTSTTKRLRVSETISLGEKRFVAIVSVEGREFLIGGGAAGMSLLAQLGSAETKTDGQAKNFADGGGAL